MKKKGLFILGVFLVSLSGFAAADLVSNSEDWRNEFSEIFGVDEYFSFWSIDQDKNGYDSSLNF